MEKKLHPLFQQNATQPQARIQTQFDPTPTQYQARKENQTPATPAEGLEFVGETKLKLSRLAQKMTHVEDRVDHFTNEIREAFSKLSGKISERVLNDTKIESMMERHNHTVNAFEKKLMQMTRLVEESQNQLITTQTALEEARKEIARLKRL